MSRPRGTNEWVIYNKYAVCVLKHGETFIDIKNLEKVRMFRWFTKKASSTNKYYVYAHYIGNKKILLHRFLMNTTDSSILVDHINGNTLDNTNGNLREVNRLQNNVNSKKRKNSVTKYKGVTKRPSGRYGCYIRYNNKNYCLGTYDTEEDAAIAYNKKALEFYDKYAKLNIIKDGKNEQSYL